MNEDGTSSLLLLLSRVEISDDVIRRAGLIIEKGIDWDRFRRMARLHGVAPLIYKNANLLRGLPEKVLESLKGAYFYSLRDALRSSPELAEIIANLKEDGIEAVPLKGVMSSEELYGDMGSYPSSDMDIMVRLRDIHRISGVMKEIGYRCDHELNEFYLSGYHDVGFYRENRKMVEFHTRMTNIRYFDIPEDFWWEDLREREFNGQSYQLLSIEKGLIFACLHITMHGYYCLKFLVTIAEMMRVFRDSLNWGKVSEYEEKFSLHHPVMLSLYLASELLDAPLPSGIKDRLKGHSRTEKWIYNKIREDIFREDASLAKIIFMFTVLQYNAFEIMIRMINWIFPSREEVAYRYGISLNSNKVYVYYLLNPILLLFQKRRV